MFREYSYVQLLMQTSVSFDLHLTTLDKLPVLQPYKYTVFVDIGPQDITMNLDDWKDRFVNSASQDTAKYTHINLQSHHSS